MTSYRIPKEKETEPSAAPHAHKGAAPASTPAAPAAPAAARTPGGSDMAGTPVPTASGASLNWTAPSHWQSRPGSAMRKATFVVTGDAGSAELAVTAFPGDVGGEVANVNRWRGQIQLPPMSDAEVAGAVTRLEANGLKIGVIEMVNPSAASPTRVLGAWVPFAGSTWFFKLTGPDALVAREKAAFLAFLQTVKPAQP